MCSICGKVPCVSGCPNAPIIYSGKVCEICASKIRAGEEYMEDRGNVVCMDCVDDMTGREIFEFFGYEKYTADEGDTADYDANRDY